MEEIRVESDTFRSKGLVLWPVAIPTGDEKLITADRDTGGLNQWCSAIRNGNMDLGPDSGMEIDVMADWKVQDLYHGLTPRTLASKRKRLHPTSGKIAAYMAGRFVEMIEDIGKTEIWNKRCGVTIEWERGQGITPKKKRDRTRQTGEQRQNGSTFMGPRSARKRIGVF
ncbi:hypothetical protein BGZ79_005918 [Entomortierella chlamydospora]|nr:hypothetical protein BGZ79_005918 [Entomortierella chlamydospora]